MPPEIVHIFFNSGERFPLVIHNISPNCFRGIRSDGNGIQSNDK